MTPSAFTPAYRRLLEILASAHRAKGITQAQLAITLDRPQSFVSKYERGERRLDVVELIDLSEALGLDPRAVVDQVRTVLAQREGGT